MFDETYYVKDAYSLWHLGYEAEWPKEYDQTFAAGDFSGLTTDPSFVVHPPLGKWIIGLGMKIFGWDNPFGWRISAAIAGILLVYLTCRLAWALFQSVVLVAVAGVLITFDGVAVSMSRIGILDGILAAFMLGGVLCIIYDQQRSARTLIWRFTARKPGWRGVAFRPWLIMAGLWLGCASAVKWSGFYLLAAGGIFVFIRELTTRLNLIRLYPGLMKDTWLGRKSERLAAIWEAIYHGGLPAFWQLVGVGAITYFASWINWFTHPQAWGHGVNLTAEGTSNLDTTIADFFSYMKQIMNFHTGVTSSHPYMSRPWQWLIMWKPTSMLYEKPNGDSGDFTVEAMSTLGNPILWWLGLAAIVLVLGYGLFVRRDYVAGVIVLGYCGIWLPWLPYWYRTIFMFYMVALVPFVVLAVTYLLAILLGLYYPHPQPVLARRDQLIPPVRSVSEFSISLALSLVIVMTVVALFFYPVVSGWPIPYSHWHWRMWLSSWI